MTTVSEKTCHRSPKPRCFSVFPPSPLFLSLGLLVLGGVSVAILFGFSSFSLPVSLSFQNVFKETASGEFESKILKEIDRNLVLQAYKRSLFPTEPFPPSYPFFAYTKPLGEYCEGKSPGAIASRVWCVGDKVQMTVYLFLRRETANGPLYEILPPSTDNFPAASFTFHVPAAHASDRVIAIGCIDFPNGAAIKDLNTIIHLERIK